MVSICVEQYQISAVGIEEELDKWGNHIPHNTIYRIMRASGLATSQPKKSRRRKQIRYESTHSNPMWYIDYKLLDDGRWFIACQGDASRFIAGYGVFSEATRRHAIDVLYDTMSRYSASASILTGCVGQFYASESEHKKKNALEFEDMARSDIRHILARVNHPQTNGKLERFHNKIQRGLDEFENILRFVTWCSHIRPHMSLDWDSLETPVGAFIRKMPPKGTTVVDEQSGEMYDVT